MYNILKSTYEKIDTPNQCFHLFQDETDFADYISNSFYVYLITLK